jgi:hypothetical protein
MTDKKLTNEELTVEAAKQKANDRKLWKQPNKGLLSDN